jgi:hypothetical protein
LGRDFVIVQEYIEISIELAVGHGMSSAFGQLMIAVFWVIGYICLSESGIIGVLGMT